MYKEYDILIKDILNNKEFIKIENMPHHGTDRLTHSKRVSYFSYIICKILRLDYVSAARAGLLHDFFMNEEDMKKRTRITSLFTHSKKALKNSSKIVYLNPKERNIIVSHMFPLGIYLPTYMESWIVQGVDKVVGTYEFIEKISAQMYTKKEYIRELIKQN